jgi:hypothetical protein
VPRISYRKGGSGQMAFAEEVFDLKLSLTKDTSTFNLASNGHRFVDLVHVQTGTSGEINFAFDFVVGALRLRDMGFGLGFYDMKVFVSAHNATSHEYDVRWSWGGTLETLKCLGISVSRAAARDPIGREDDHADDVEIPSFRLRMKCSKCGGRDVDVRPNWKEQPPADSLTGKQWR